MANTIHPYISDDEAWAGSRTALAHGIDNTPPPEIMQVMTYTALRIFTPLRHDKGVPIYVPSFYRCQKLNAVLPGASKKSQHMLGEALDMVAILSTGLTNKEIFDYILKNLDYDQLIWEYGTDEEPQWIHVSIKYEGENRKEVWRREPGEWILL